MNPLLEQFVSEGRDLLEQSSRALLALEQNPADATQLDALFRAVHTVKGASGLFDIVPFTRAVHAGEDVLDAVREGDIRFGPVLADLLLELLDQVADWLTALESTGTLPKTAESAGQALAEGLRSQLDVQEATASALVAETAGTAAGGEPWPSSVPEEIRNLGTAMHLVRYQPDRTAFYSGDDPLLTAMTTPGLHWLGVCAPDAWPDAASLDPFEALAGFELVSEADRETLVSHFLYVEDQIEIAAVAQAPAISRPATPSQGQSILDDGLVVHAVSLVEAQQRLLSQQNLRAPLGACIAAAAAVLGRVARHAGLTQVSADVATLLAGKSDERETAQALAGIAAGMVRALQAPVAAPSALPVQDAGPVADIPEEEPEQAAGGPAARKSTVIRVDSDRIDQLMNLAGELIVAKNALPFLARRAEEIPEARALVREIKSQHDSINRIAEELQSAVMQIRMVPVGTVLGRFNRLVRDLSRKLDKRIRLEIKGEDTEADKAVVEELADPMVHLLRNAIDHGLESPADRRAAGKPEEGTISLSAWQQDDSVVIEVADDGRGIDVERIKQKALQKGMIEPDVLARLSEEAALQLILTPGLSTRDEISDLSGRGVGMDVVANMVRRVGGQIGLTSTPGVGTKIRVSLPLSMAVQRLMMVEVHGGLYGVSVDAVVESQRLPVTAIHRHREDEIVHLRGRIIPLLRLRRLFGCPPEPERQEFNVMVVEVDGNEVGLVVDRFHAGVDAIVKPMEGILAGANCYSGTALLGDGSVLLALNLQEVLTCRWK